MSRRLSFLNRKEVRAMAKKKAAAKKPAKKAPAKKKKA